MTTLIFCASPGLVPNKPILKYNGDAPVNLGKEDNVLIDSLSERVDLGIKPMTSPSTINDSQNSPIFYADDTTRYAIGEQGRFLPKVGTIKELQTWLNEPDLDMGVGRSEYLKQIRIVNATQTEDINYNLPYDNVTDLVINNAYIGKFTLTFGYGFNETVYTVSMEINKISGYTPEDLLTDISLNSKVSEFLMRTNTRVSVDLKTSALPAGPNSLDGFRVRISNTGIYNIFVALEGTADNANVVCPFITGPTAETPPVTPPVRAFMWLLPLTPQIGFAGTSTPSIAFDSDMALPTTVSGFILYKDPNRNMNLKYPFFMESGHTMTEMLRAAGIEGFAQVKSGASTDPVSYSLLNKKKGASLEVVMQFNGTFTKPVETPIDGNLNGSYKEEGKVIGFILRGNVNG